MLCVFFTRNRYFHPPIYMQHPQCPRRGLLERRAVWSQNFETQIHIAHRARRSGRAIPSAMNARSKTMCSARASLYFCKSAAPLISAAPAAECRLCCNEAVMRHPTVEGCSRFQEFSELLTGGASLSISHPKNDFEGIRSRTTRPSFLCLSTKNKCSREIAVAND